jgi:hypothetical protein
LILHAPSAAGFALSWMLIVQPGRAQVTASAALKSAVARVKSGR